MDIIIPKNLNFSVDPDWEILERVLPNGYRHVASVQRPSSDGSLGEMYDLGQNKEGNFLLFRRSTDPNSINSHGRGEVLSPTDLVGFGLLSHQSRDIEASLEGEYTSLCKSNLIGV